MSGKLSILILSHIYPFPGHTGQQQRVYYTLKSLRDHFHITFLGTAPRNQIPQVRRKLAETCDDVIVLPALFTRNWFVRHWHRSLGIWNTLLTGLKFSNYLVSKVEFSPSRVENALVGNKFDLCLFEYWHAARNVEYFQQCSTPVVLDMHNILWQSYRRQLKSNRLLPKLWKDWAVRQYQEREETAWDTFDALIAISAGEYEYTKAKVGGNVELFLAPMGTDLARWPYLWEPVKPPRLAYYGGLGSPHNMSDALTCYLEVMPLVWQRFPDAQLWLVGSNPPGFLLDLAANDPRVVVTGYVQHVQDVLSTMALILCPWTGTYGFRSRLIEAMAQGVPVIASMDAVYGMGLEEGKSFMPAETTEQMAEACIRLLNDLEYATQRSRFARKLVEEKYSLEATYGKLALDLQDFTLRQKKIDYALTRSIKK